MQAVALRSGAKGVFRTVLESVNQNWMPEGSTEGTNR